MKREFLGVLLVSIATLFLAGCPRQALVYNVRDAPVLASADQYSKDDVKKAIMRAGASLGWNIREVGPGQLEGTLYLRKHMAKVDIPYNHNSYSILYKESDNLRYDGEKIHSNYNGWIQNLDRAIKSQIGLL